MQCQACSQAVIMIISHLVGLLLLLLNGLVVFHCWLCLRLLQSSRTPVCLLVLSYPRPSQLSSYSRTLLKPTSPTYLYFTSFLFFFYFFGKIKFLLSASSAHLGNMTISRTNVVCCLRNVLIAMSRQDTTWMADSLR